MPNDFLIPIIGLCIAMIGILSTLAYKFHRDSKKESFDKGKSSSDTKHLESKLSFLETEIKDLRDDIEKGHLDLDVVQKQLSDSINKIEKYISDIRVGLARLEGPK